MTDDHPPSSSAEGPAGDDPGPRRLPALSDEQDLPVDTERLVESATRALDLLGVPGEAELSIALVSSDRIAELKWEAFGERAVTDVLSFPMDDPADPMPGPLMLGDVVLCVAAAEHQARSLGRATADELDQLLVHGLLHLLGRVHDDARAELAMAAEERRVLGGLRGAA